MQVSPTPPEFAIQACAIQKTYAASGKAPEKHALNGLDLTVPKGSIFGLLGPNGAGKSTFINIIAGLVVKTSGRLNIWGIDIDQDHRAAKGAIGIVPQEITVDAFFTPFETLELQAGFYGCHRVSGARWNCWKLLVSRTNAILTRAPCQGA